MPPDAVLDALARLWPLLNAADSKAAIKRYKDES